MRRFLNGRYGLYRLTRRLASARYDYYGPRQATRTTSDHHGATCFPRNRLHSGLPGGTSSQGRLLSTRWDLWNAYPLELPRACSSYATLAVPVTRSCSCAIKRSRSTGAPCSDCDSSPCSCIVSACCASDRRVIDRQMPATECYAVFAL